MEGENQTFIKEFILVGYSKNVHICIIFFISLLIMYIFTIFGNIFLICTVIVSPKLHLPMYFFLCNLSLIDLCFSSSSIPKVLMSIFSVKRTISVTGCLVQMHFGIFLGSTESFLLAVMAYDRYVAICLPLYYHVIMKWNICGIITIIMWSVSFLLSVAPYMSKSLIFCTENKLDHFVCEMLAVLEIACGNNMFYRVTLLIMTFFILVAPVVFIVMSYIVIILSILKIKSTDGRSKAFSTCASHLIVVSMFYGTTITMYLGQTKSFARSLKYISVLYGSFTPLLNPLIYSLRNNDVKEAFQKILTQYSL